MTDRQHTPGCPHCELAVGWALHALEPAEEILVAAHLPDCSECTRTVAETELVGAVLGLSVPEAMPSAELEQRVLAVTTTAHPSPVMPLAPSTRPAPDIVPQATVRSPKPPAASPVWWVPRRPRRREPICVPETLVLVSVALVVLVVAFAFAFYAVP